MAFYDDWSTGKKLGAAAIAGLAIWFLIRKSAHLAGLPNCSRGEKLVCLR